MFSKLNVLGRNCQVEEKEASHQHEINPTTGISQYLSIIAINAN